MPFISSPHCEDEEQVGEGKSQETDWLPGCPWRQHMGEECVAGERLLRGSSSPKAAREVERAQRPPGG